ncbi:MAG: hypothetical protein ACRDYU_03855 [Actinomycetes bacterium]
MGRAETLAQILTDAEQLDTDRLTELAEYAEQLPTTDPSAGHPPAPAGPPRPLQPPTGAGADTSQEEQ